jgi:hypothetical protein
MAADFPTASTGRDNPFAASTAAAERSILDLRMNDTTPFITHRDGINDRLREARGLLLVLEAAFRTARDVPQHCAAETIQSLNPEIVADAIEGVSTLLALGQHHENERGA